MPLQATSGAASYEAFGGGVPFVPTYIEDVMSTFLYTGNGSTQTITNGIDLSGKGGLVWLKDRGNVGSHRLVDTVRGNRSTLFSESTSAAVTRSDDFSCDVSSFNSNGFTAGNFMNQTSNNYVSWTFREQAKFFDVVTYTGNGSSNQVISHALGSVPGCVIIKRTDSTSDWYVYHRGHEFAPSEGLALNLTASGASTYRALLDVPTSTTFTSYIANTNTSGATYVAYLFAHNAGGFGLTGTDNVISCGSFTTDGSGNATVNLGYEPQYLMYKRSDGVGNWRIIDNMRGWSLAPDSLKLLYADSSLAENTDSNAVVPNATGFTTVAGNIQNSATFIYIAIRRGPMKVPTDGTKVFIPVSATPSGATAVTTNFPVDLAINAQRDAATSGNKVFWDRLRGSSTAAGQGLFSNLTNAEVSYSGNGIGLQSNTTLVDNYWNTLNGATTPVIYWNFRRAPGFFDEVCYTGTGSTSTYSHNLGVAPELMIVKSRNDVNDWAVYSAALGNTANLRLNTTAASSTALNLWASTTPSATTFTTNGTYNLVGGGGITYVAYLFASCPGVSKVGSVTHVEPTTVSCGFTPRFVLLKSTASTGTDDWYVFDSARGITSGNDPYLRLNSTGAENTPFGAADFIDPTADGFIMNGFGGGNYIFLAIA